MLFKKKKITIYPLLVVTYSHCYNSWHLSLFLLYKLHDKNVNEWLLQGQEVRIRMPPAAVPVSFGTQR